MKTNLVFKSVTYKNFMATGNKAVTIQLNDKPTTLIYGKNGSGKSTMYEALYYGLYGKAFRKARIPDLINNINNKHMEVIVEFSAGGQDFKVVRGRHYAKGSGGTFEIYRNGKLVDQAARSYDYQTHLERHILGMSSATFMQTVILGSLHYVPFMRIRKIKDRMAIIEELLDIQIFSSMNQCTRDRLNAINRDLKEMFQKDELLTNSIDLLERHIDELESKNAGQKSKIDAEIEELTKTKLQLEDSIKTLNASRNTIDLSAKAELEKERDNWNRYKTIAHRELSELNNHIAFYQESDVCDRCEQDIKPEFKEDAVNKAQERKSKIEKAMETKILPGIDATALGLQNIQKLTDQLVELNSQIVETNSQIDSTQANIDRLQRSLKEESETSGISDKRVELGRYKAQRTKLSKKRAGFETEAAEYELVLALLKDDGIKKNIIKMYIPIINKLISKYLSILGFPIKFTFDEHFKENIIVKGRRDLTYSSFSAGEKMRVDLALLFAFREIPIIRSGNSCNLLIFDEVADSAMDSEGWDQFLTIINSISDVGNVFVISPRGDVLVDKFTKSLRFEKKGAFSTLDMNV